MPKYEDFKVGDVWIRRDGKEAVIAEVRVITADTPEGFTRFPIDSKSLENSFNTHTVNGKVWSIEESDGDLLHRKEQGLDLTKPLRFKKGGSSFTAEELENVPEPQMRVLKAWVLVDRDGLPMSVHSTYHLASVHAAAYADHMVVAVEQEYVV